MDAESNTNVSITRRFTFSAGHRLMHHGGKCENLHGHNYVVEISVSGSRTDPVGRVVDFSVLNRLFKDWIDGNWDHAMVLSRDDEQAIAAIRSVEPHRIYLLPWNPTAENMARYLLEIIGPRLMDTVEGYELYVSRVVLWETEASRAEVQRLQAAGETGTRWHDAPAWQQTWSG